MGIFAIRSEGNNVANRLMGSNGVRNVRNERPPVRFVVRARVKPTGKLLIFIQEKKNDSWHRIQTEKKYSDKGWHDYVVFKKISANISGMTCGIYWIPESGDSELDILSIKCFITR